MLLEMKHIHKSFGPVRVLTDIEFALRPAEVHVLAGENGAGKSTLMKILGGVYSNYSGTIELDGRPVRFKSVRDASSHGISVIHQELSLIGALPVYENIYLGREANRFS